MKATRLDRLVAWLSPRRGRRRMLERFALELIARRFEAASSSRRTSGWVAAGTDANAEIGPSLPKLRARCRQLIRDNGWARKAVAVLVNNAVGIQGIVPRPGLEGDAKARVSDLWRAWAGSTACDVEGRKTFAGLQRQATRTLIEGGEVIVRRVLTAGLRPLPLQLQVLEGDHLDLDTEELREDGSRTIQGVELDRYGRRRAYWLHPDHPGDASGYIRRREPIRVPAADVLHVFREDRAGQVRGVPWGAPAALRLRDFDEYTDAQLLRAKIAAMFVGFVTDPEAAGLAAPLEAAEAEDPRLQTFEPGTWEVLPPGKDVRFSDPPKVEGFSDYATVTLREIAAAFGVTYEQLTGDYSRVNFSSGRMGWIEQARETADLQRHTLVPLLCGPAWAWFLEAGELTGALPQLEPSAVRWSAPRREMIDPVKETAARVTRVRAGFSTLSEELRADGLDPDELLAEHAADDELLDELGLVLDTDPRKRTATGATVDGEGAGEGDGDELEGDDQADGNATTGSPRRFVGLLDRFAGGNGTGG